MTNHYVFKIMESDYCQTFNRKNILHGRMAKRKTVYANIYIEYIFSVNK